MQVSKQNYNENQESSKNQEEIQSCVQQITDVQISKETRISKQRRWKTAPETARPHFTWSIKQTTRRVRKLWFIQCFSTQRTKARAQKQRRELHCHYAQTSNNQKLSLLSPPPIINTPMNPQRKIEISNNCFANTSMIIQSCDRDEKDPAVRREFSSFHFNFQWITARNLSKRESAQI